MAEVIGCLGKTCPRIFAQFPESFSGFLSNRNVVFIERDCFIDKPRLKHHVGGHDIIESSALIDDKVENVQDLAIRIPKPLSEHLHRGVLACSRLPFRQVPQLFL
jgi:hypothetical protein